MSRCGRHLLQSERKSFITGTDLGILQELQRDNVLHELSSLWNLRFSYSLPPISEPNQGTEGCACLVQARLLNDSHTSTAAVCLDPINLAGHLSCWWPLHWVNHMSIIIKSSNTWKDYKTCLSVNIRYFTEHKVNKTSFPST